MTVSGQPGRRIKQVPTVATDSVEAFETSDGAGLSAPSDVVRSTSSAASSSISVASVPFEVTGDGPTKSLGLIRCEAGDRPLSKEWALRLDESAEFREDL